MADLVQSENPYVGILAEMMLSPQQRFMRLLGGGAGMSTLNPAMAAPAPAAPAPTPAAPAAPAAEDSFVPLMRQLLQQAQAQQTPTVAQLPQDTRNLALMRLGAGLMQPRQVGGTYAGIIGNALTGYTDTLDKARKDEESRMWQRLLAQGELATKGASIGASEAATAGARGREAREGELFPMQKQTAGLNVRRAEQGLEKDRLELQDLQARLALLTPEERKRMHELDKRVKEAQIGASNAAAGASAAAARASDARTKLAEQGNQNIDAYIEVALDEMNLDSNDRTKPANRAKARVRANQMMEEDSRRGLYGPQNSAEAAVYRANLTAAINGLKAQLENLPLGNKPEIAAERERINKELADLTSRLTQSLLQGGGTAKPGGAPAAAAPKNKRYNYTDIVGPGASE